MGLFPAFGMDKARIRNISFRYLYNPHIPLNSFRNTQGDLQLIQIVVCIRQPAHIVITG